jgi:CdiI N-terminal domain
MTAFYIALSEDHLEPDGEAVALGSLKLGEFQEGFHASLSHWDQSRYRSQWKEALERLVKGEERSALITSMYDPATANFITWWPLYRSGNSVHAQNHFLFMDELQQPFDELNPYKSVLQRETISEDGDRLSEWTINLSDIEEFLATHYGLAR